MDYGEKHCLQRQDSLTHKMWVYPYSRANFKLTSRWIRSSPQRLSNIHIWQVDRKNGRDILLYLHFRKISALPRTITLEREATTGEQSQRKMTRTPRFYRSKPITRKSQYLQELRHDCEAYKTLTACCEVSHYNAVLARVAARLRSLQDPNIMLRDRPL